MCMSAGLMLLSRIRVKMAQTKLFQEWVEPAMLELYHVYVKDCLNTSHSRLDENGYSLNAAHANMQPRVTQTLKVY